MSDIDHSRGGVSGSTRPSVLVVEDEPLVRHVISEILEDDNFDVVACESGAQAIDALNSGAVVDAALLDVDLERPGAGFAVARCARATRPDLLVVYTSGGGQADFARERVQGSLFVPKPYTPQRLSGLIRSELDRARD